MRYITGCYAIVEGLGEFRGDVLLVRIYTGPNGRAGLGDRESTNYATFEAIYILLHETLCGGSWGSLRANGV